MVQAATRAAVEGEGLAECALRGAALTQAIEGAGVALAAVVEHRVRIPIGACGVAIVTSGRERCAANERAQRHCFFVADGLL